MKRLCQTLCTKCGRVWIGTTQLVVQQQELCPDCKIPGLIRYNPPIGVGIINK